MCGIGRVRNRPAAPPNRAILERMADAIRHRGPDESGYYQDEWASLGHRRLSIIDLATGQQPMTNEDGRLEIVYNGEIFNHADLRPGAGAGRATGTRRGATQRPSCTPTSSTGRRAWSGSAACFRIRHLGQGKRGGCSGARDRLGKKPLYYYYERAPVRLCVGNQGAARTSGTSRLPSMKPRCRNTWPSGYLNDDRTMFSGIRKLMPGHHLTLEAEKRRN